MVDHSIPNSSEYVSIHEAAEIIGCSNKRVYQYVMEGRLPAQRIGRMLILPIEAVKQFKPAPSGRTRTKTPAWRNYRSRGKFLITLIQVPVRAQNEEKLQEKLRAIEAEQHIFTGSVARYIFGDAERIQIALIWKETEMPDEATRRQDLFLFQQAFPELNWEAAHICTKDVLRHT
jgi:excisionase family DNA binding protein